ncbi:hypothetical protein FDB52_02990 [Clostridium botulinum]|uniref:hypothetical protein n=1 Tax=Clostridium botulinum TaxID=1491 RepID=UPI0007740851|nr:hypothetical protein [Clostridium botulinum]MBN1043756.1 hypothetical protein [Clostridium botulinum]NFE93687.1 hypothetical protein [Clostridium botulinum]NFL38437.1 hypothetical protein [Clostridium botulinum]NFL65877.1 hypothetical protein [Clostridium botulinum]NFN08274.1 hypothetical protein [Clostridium botulinum]
MKLEVKNISGQPFIKIGCKEFNLTVGHSMYLVFEELRSLNTGLEIKFENFSQFKKLINQINKIIHKN